MKKDKILKYIYYLLLLIGVFLIALDFRYQINVSKDYRGNDYISVFDSWTGKFKRN